MSDYSELVKRLRMYAPQYLNRESADAIEAQAKRIAELEAALKPFADEEDAWIGFDDKERLVEPFPKLSDISRITVGDLRRTRAALGENEW